MEIGNKLQRNAFTLAVISGCVLLIMLAQFKMINLYVQSVMMFMGINIMIATSLNLVNGNMGEFSCGHAAFLCVGAYVSSLTTVLLLVPNGILGDPLLPPQLSVLVFPISVLVGGVVAALAGILVALPSFKTRGDYLAIITIAVNYMVISGIENLDIIGGPRGFMGMKKVVKAMYDVADIPWMMIFVAIGTIFCVVMIRRYISSTFGKGVNAICQDEIAAEIMSVNTNKVKLVTFMLSSGLCGMAGGLFAHVVGYVNPQSFNILKSTEAMVMVYLGGMGSLSGAVLSAVFFTFLLELLRPLQILKWVIIPLTLVLLMQFRPEGIMGNKELTDIFPKLRKYCRFK
ncbi:branched-chain amino acid ABC transporter permease [Paucidesulfovibrio longus]|uniref:branched-chain amino acid ABC transporter permease n=1 Tax=Paucidesulfovibrio longus TaxID=889 RepID=UPI0003B4C3BD|nr:branched-chain amino acid ABC transporter permease [Paucidesulfovibrio longus]